MNVKRKIRAVCGGADLYNLALGKVEELCELQARQGYVDHVSRKREKDLEINPTPTIIAYNHLLLLFNILHPVCH